MTSFLLNFVKKFINLFLEVNPLEQNKGMESSQICDSEASGDE